ncbi:O-antigen polymerase [Psychromonas sp. CNPT3]|uniref:PglL family O-oligosaccharyltransferase n=1 Tax=Psychromonas sp. CNPT3 TaxID=314282 RepID=UPI00006E9E9D|nr:Wzy polymerase domain-containing protein [Psychromonas sp. CNPT3]AGH82185.1 O-antigen polymerase [Psychromonas sp. CNPT3]
MRFKLSIQTIYKIVFFLLMAVGMHYVQINRGGSGLALPQNNIVWIFISLLISLGLYQVSRIKTLYYSHFSIAFLIAIVFFCVPLIYANNTLAIQSASRLLGLGAGFLVFLSFQQMRFKKSDILHLLIFIVLAGALQAMYSLIQSYLLSEHNFIGYDIHYGRPYGVFQQPNVLASFMATTLILSAYLLSKVHCQKQHVFLLISAFLCMWVLVLTQSRSGYLGLLIALAFVAPLLYSAHKKRFFFLLLALSLGLSCALLKDDALQSRSLETMQSGGPRITLYTQSMQMILEKPLLGYGYGSFPKSYLFAFAKSVSQDEFSAQQGYLTHPHNEFLFWAVEGGIAPLFAILILCVAFLRLLRTQKRKQALAFCALVIPIIVHTQTELPLYQSAIHWFTLLFLVFYIDNATQNSKNCHFNAPLILKLSALLLPLICALFMLTNLMCIDKITHYERSKDKNIKALTSIINPFVFQSRIEYHFSNYRLALAIQAKRPLEIIKLIKVVEKKIKTTPRAYYYLLLYTAYSKTDQNKKATEILAQARYLFPLNEHILQLDSASIK